MILSLLALDPVLQAVVWTCDSFCWIVAYLWSKPTIWQEGPWLGFICIDYLIKVGVLIHYVSAAQTSVFCWYIYYLLLWRVPSWILHIHGWWAESQSRTSYFIGGLVWLSYCQMHPAVPSSGWVYSEIPLTAIFEIHFSKMDFAAFTSYVRLMRRVFSNLRACLLSL